ncbi:MAG: InlB B-repeat-containing protein [Clostridiales bacterium]|nr:InlB B-repeat-containing protein [Clostridiales bacterium]
MAQITVTKKITLLKNQPVSVFRFDNVSLPTGASWKRWKATANDATQTWIKIHSSQGYLKWDTWYTNMELILEGNTPTMRLSNPTSDYRSFTVTLTFEYNPGQFNITCHSSTGGSLTASANKAVVGSTVTLYPSANTGYQFSGWSSSPAVTITNNKFTMPQSNVTITANFTKKNYTITKAASPAAGGTVTTSVNTAQMGNSVSVSQAPNTGYYFNGWTTSPALTISGGAFTMPASNVSITAKYLRRSTATLSKTSMAGGDTITLSISSESAAYTHKYQLSFGENMETALTDVAAGVTSVSISVPASWSNYIPNAASKGSGTCTVYTYSGETQIGSYTISGLTYNVPAGAVPAIGAVTKSIARTIGGVTYADIGEIYTQNKCGVRVQASAAGVYSSTIASLKVELSGFSGSDYNKTVASGNIDFTSGLLTIAGTLSILVTATDSRGRTATKTETITVTAYNAPVGSLDVWRVDANGDEDPLGQYAKYAQTANYSQIGNNTLTVTLTSQGSSKTSPASTGDILPDSRQTFSTQQEFTITLTLADAFETVTVQTKLQSARFIIYVNSSGSKMGFMKAAGKAIPAGKDSTVEFSADSQIYIGDDTLEDYIRAIVNNM